jgi:hypothetical protein
MFKAVHPAKLNTISNKNKGFKKWSGFPNFATHQLADPIISWFADEPGAISLILPIHHWQISTLAQH